MRRHRFAVSVERGGTDRYGDPTSAPVGTIAGCFDWPVSSSETYGALTEVTSDRVLWAPSGSDIRTDDTLVYPSGERWHVVGRPEDWRHPRVGHAPGLEVRVSLRG